MPQLRKLLLLRRQKLKRHQPQNLPQLRRPQLLMLLLLLRMLQLR